MTNETSGGEDVYDLAVWCRICDAPHSECEPFDEPNECIVCGVDVEPDQDYCAKHQLP